LPGRIDITLAEAAGDIPQGNTVTDLGSADIGGELRELLAEHIDSKGATRTEPDGVHVGDVVTDDIQLFLLETQATNAGIEGSEHRFILGFERLSSD
jgi:hypothetical protein